MNSYVEESMKKVKEYFEAHESLSKDDLIDFLQQTELSDIYDDSSSRNLVWEILTNYQQEKESLEPSQVIENIQKLLVKNFDDEEQIYDDTDLLLSEDDMKKVEEVLLLLDVKRSRDYVRINCEDVKNVIMKYKFLTLYGDEIIKIFKLWEEDNFYKITKETLKKIEITVGDMRFELLEEMIREKVESNNQEMISILKDIRKTDLQLKSEKILKDKISIEQLEGFEIVPISNKPHRSFTRSNLSSKTNYGVLQHKTKRVSTLSNQTKDRMLSYTMKTIPKISSMTNLNVKNFSETSGTEILDDLGRSDILLSQETTTVAGDRYLFETTNLCETDTRLSGSENRFYSVPSTDRLESLEKGDGSFVQNSLRNITAINNNNQVLNVNVGPNKENNFNSFNININNNNNINIISNSINNYRTNQFQGFKSSMNLVQRQRFSRSIGYVSQNAYLRPGVQGSTSKLRNDEFLLPEKQNTCYDFLSLKDNITILRILEENKENVLPYEIYTGHIYINNSKDKTKLVLLITSNNIYMLDDKKYSVIYVEPLKQLISASISPYFFNIIALHFNDNVKDDLLFETFNRFDLLAYFRDLYKFKGWYRKKKLKIFVSNEFKIKTDGKIELLQLKTKKNKFLLTCNLENALKFGYMYQYQESFLKNSYFQKFFVLTNIGLIIFDHPNSLPKDIIPIIGIEIKVIDHSKYKIYGFEFITQKGEHLIFGTLGKSDFYSWSEEFQKLQKTYSSKMKTIDTIVSNIKKFRAYS